MGEIKKDAQYYHVAIIRDMKDFEGGTFEEESLKNEGQSGIYVETGLLEDGSRVPRKYEFYYQQWSIDQVKSYLKKNDINYKKIIPAKEKKVDTNCRVDIIDFVPIPTDEQGKEIINDVLYEKMKRTPEGYLKGRAVVTNVGVFPYRMDDGSVRWELRPPEEVFNEDSINSLKLKPITDNHPTEAVTSENIKRLGVGTLGENIKTDAYRISVPIEIQKADTVENVNAGKRALSCGYTVDVEEKEGNWMGVPYQAVQRNIRYNHVALVDRGRAGDAAVLKTDTALRMDSADEDIKSFGYQITKKQMEVKPMLKKIKLDNGVEYEAEEKVIDALHDTKTKLDSTQVKLNESVQETDKLKEDMSILEAKKDTLEEENKKLKEDLEAAKEVDPQKIDEVVKRRLKLVSSAEKAEVEVKDDMSEMDIKKAVILKVSPDAKEKLDGADDVYIEARFDLICEGLEKSQKQDHQNNVNLTDNPGEHKKERTAEDARNDMIKRYNNTEEK